MEVYLKVKNKHPRFLQVHKVNVTDNYRGGHQPLNKKDKVVSHY